MNDETVLKAALLASPDIGEVEEVILKRGAKSAAQAYNEGLRESRGDWVVFAHQDVYLPPGWLCGLQRQIDHLAVTDPVWGVCGAFGITAAGEGVGWVYSTGLGMMLGRPGVEPRPVDTLDEMLLVLRRGSGLRFDERLPGFHLYGADLCLEARRQGLNAYAVATFCVHNSRGIRFLPFAYWKSYFYMRRKWWDRLPMATPCMKLSRSSLPVLKYLLWRVPFVLATGGRVGKPSPAPALLHEQLAVASEVREAHPPQVERRIPKGPLP